MGQKYQLDTQDVKASLNRMTCTNCLFVSGSIVHTVALLAVGMAFFAPYWLSNIPATGVKELSWASPAGQLYLPRNSSYYPDRGLWAQCGAECEWFWENGYMLQKQMLTPISKSRVQISRNDAVARSLCKICLSLCTMQHVAGSMAVRLPVAACATSAFYNAVWTSSSFLE